MNMSKEVWVLLKKTYIWNCNRADNGARSEIPETQGIIMHNAKRRFKDGNWDHKIRGENDVVFPVNSQPVRVEWLFDDIESSCDICGEFVDDVVICIGFYQTTGRSSCCRAHVRDEKSTAQYC
jgi:hypothetical protein